MGKKDRVEVGERERARANRSPHDINIGWNNDGDRSRDNSRRQPTPGPTGATPPSLERLTSDHAAGERDVVALAVRAHRGVELAAPVVQHGGRLRRHCNTRRVVLLEEN